DPGTGNITVAPTVANYQQGDLVQWEAVGGTSLTLSFTKGNGTPFDVDTIVGTAGGGTATAERTILTTAAKQSYHYSLKAKIGGKDYTIQGCPEIVVG
ncbi:MAG TPA: hypothetical protein VFV14_01680, partial [Myxococcaceae bacterium]|nr:hypothetical protein [Myxococcaceae bacterium]